MKETVLINDLTERVLLDETPNELEEILTVTKAKLETAKAENQTNKTTLIILVILVVLMVGLFIYKNLKEND